MNLRQKYKKTKQELEFYKKQTPRIKYLKEEALPVIKLQVTDTIQPHDLKYLEEFIQMAKEKIANDAMKYAKVEASFDIKQGLVVVRARMSVLDEKLRGSEEKWR